MMRAIAGGISPDGAMITAFENAFLEFGITRFETVKRYMVLMENKGLIIRRGERWFRVEGFAKAGTKKEEHVEADPEVDSLLDNLGVTP
jgi:hypothetical protein